MANSILMNKGKDPSTQTAPVLANDKQKAAPDEQPKKGKDKWASDGFDNLMDHSSDDKDTQGQLKDGKGAMLNDPKTKDLLVQASDLKPGTPAMDKMLEKIKSRMAKGQ